MINIICYLVFLSFIFLIFSVKQQKKLLQYLTKMVWYICYGPVWSTIYMVMTCLLPLVRTDPVFNKDGLIHLLWPCLKYNIYGYDLSVTVGKNWSSMIRLPWCYTHNYCTCIYTSLDLYPMMVKCTWCNIMR